MQNIRLIQNNMNREKTKNIKTYLKIKSDPSITSDRILFYIFVRILTISNQRNIFPMKAIVEPQIDIKSGISTSINYMFTLTTPKKFLMASILTHSKQIKFLLHGNKEEIKKLAKEKGTYIDGY